MKLAEINKPVEKQKCFHCGEECADTKIQISEKIFCCFGCKTVYEILNENNLCGYYDFEKNPGANQKLFSNRKKFAYLNDETIKKKLLLFQEGKTAVVKFYLPQIHCSSCIWLLEHLSKMDKGILKSETDFLKKEITIRYNQSLTDPGHIAETLSIVGYEPHISLENEEVKENTSKKTNRTRILKIGLAGFCFGNIMMLSFPEYFSFGKTEDKNLMLFFSYINLFLSIPVFFYCASEFFISAYKSIRQKFLNIDAPIALAILITFSRSVYEILTHVGPGYLDSMSGIVFFMLIGRYFQEKTHESVSFERGYKSYFPLGITQIASDGTETQIPVSKLKTGDRIKIYSEEIIPADSILFFGNARIDYSFVTGESLPVEKGIGEIIYAGGKQKGSALEMEVVKEVSQSYLTNLWNNDTFKKEKTENKKSFIHKTSRYFTLILFSIAVISGIYWQINDPSKVWKAVTSVLIIACPCTLLLSSTFTNGFMVNILKSKNFFLKNAEVIEKIGETDFIVFDKTGTITEQGTNEIYYSGASLPEKEKQSIFSLASQSNHPLSRAVRKIFSGYNLLPVKNFHEEKGRGIEAEINGGKIKIGSAEFTGSINPEKINSGSIVHVTINGQEAGNFIIRSKYREGIHSVFTRLKQKFRISILSGDNDSEEEKLNSLLGNDVYKFFNRSPQDKLNYIKGLQDRGKKVIMLGDGLNDSGALMQSDCGIVITDDINNFTPASDAVMDGKNFQLLPDFISYCKKSKKIVYGSFIFSILYNFIGMYFATRAELQPVIAAILMPLSSISIILFSGLAAKIYSRKLYC